MATRNPIPSEAPEDLVFNAGKIDEEVNSDAEYYIGRLDKRVLTAEGRNKQFLRSQANRDSIFNSQISGQENTFNSFLSSSEAELEAVSSQYGWRFIEYQAGNEIERLFDYVTVPEGNFSILPSTPLPYVLVGDWNIDKDFFTPASDAPLRGDLADPEKGATMVARAVVSVDGIADLLNLPDGQRREGLQYSVASFYEGKNKGGGVFMWDASKDKSGADGGTIVDPDSIGGFDGNQNSLDGFLLAQGTGEGLGCWVRVYDGLIEPEWFGAVGDGISDDSSALQSAITAGSVLLSNTTYHIGVTIDVPSNREIKSKGKATILGKMFQEGGVNRGYPLTLFNSVSASDISFSGIVFDFAKREYNYAVADGLTMRNGLYFESVSNLRFNNCEFFDFVTNLKADHEMIELLYFGAVQIKECTDIHLYDIKTSMLREEGFNFYKCRNIKFSGWQANGANSSGGYETSSHAAFWYCEGVLVENADIIHVGGSIFNCCSKHVTYRNVRVNYGRDGRGNGFDFGNELGVEQYSISNTLIEKCYINVNGAGVYHVDLEGFTSTLDNIKITDCVIRGNSSGIAIGSVNGLKVFNNEILISKPTGAEIYNGVSAVQIRPKENPVVENIDVSDNLITARMLLVIHPSHDSPLDAGEVYVKNNNVTFHVFDEEAAGIGVSHGIRNSFASVAYGTSPINYRKIQIDGNTFKEAMGIAQINTRGTVDVLQITNNTGKTTSGYTSNQLSSMQCASKGGLVFDENNIYERFRPTAYTGFDSVTFSNNVILVQPYSDNENAAPTSCIYSIPEEHGKLRVTNNIVKGLLSEHGGVRIIGDTETMDIIEIRDNWFYSTGGVLVAGHQYTNTPREFP